MAKGNIKKGKSKVGQSGSICGLEKKIDVGFEGMDKRFKKVDDWRVSMDNWRYKTDVWMEEMSVWRTTVSIDLACMKEDIRWIKEVMYTKQEHNELMTKIDFMVGELQESRRERQIQGYRYVTISDQVDDHEKRIGVLEKKA
jgi:hypothetical protein